MKYDIQTLLALSQNARIEIGKFSDQALGNNLLRQHQTSTNALVEQPVNQSRTVSNISHQTESSPSRLHYPIRPPKDPPRSNLAQIDTGFARFLKDHTSPKHQRVTAGGRIVPMEPESPVPRMRLAVQKQHMRDYGVDESGSLSGIERGSASGNLPMEAMEAMEVNSNTSDISKNSVCPTGILPDLAKLSFQNGALDQAVQATAYPSNISWAAIPPGTAVPSSIPLAFNGQQLPPLDQQPQMTYVPVIPEHAAYGYGSDIQTAFPNIYQTSNVQDPSPSIPASLHPHLPVPTASSDFSSCSNAASVGSSAFSQYQLGYNSYYPTFVPQVYQSVGSQFPVFKQPSGLQGTPREMPHLKCLDEAEKQHESLSAQLSRLDKYMAIHTWDIDPQSKKLMVEQRKSLVRELDAVRISDDQKEANARLLVPSSIYLPGSVANSQVFLRPMSSASSTSYVSQMPPAYLASPALPLPVPESEASASVFPWPNLGSPIFHNTAIGVKDMPIGNYNLSQQRKDMGSNQGLNQEDRQTQAHSSISNDRTGGTSNGQSSSRIPSPLDLRHLYIKIEEATKLGEPVDELLKELSIVTTRLVKQRREEGKTPRRPIQSKPAMPSLTIGRADSARIAPSSRLMKYARQPWGLEVTPWAPVRSYREASSMSDIEGNEKLSSSYISTTDSWATVYEGNKRWVGTSSLAGSKHGKDPENLSESSRNFARYKFASAETLASGALRSSRWIKEQLDSNALESHNTTLRRAHRVRGGNPNMPSMKQPTSPLNTQHLSKNGGLVFEKTAALAVPQTINVQAYVPPFDGPGDAPRNETSQCTMGNVNRQTQGIVSQHSFEEAGPWYLPKERVKPSRETLLEFFRKLKDDEKREMHNSQIEAQPSCTRANGQ
ncbi:uncharacterized protein BDW43DRAFT_311717 [Aspergillus alliaceus]|uniref:uncharacterized protein n=1 Tax=Petromyces alliaceus TaxID=209559 RepID=UPI0012A4B562|nr:uncharacterized protein BDW43DRAFT_311717 [Aspergillus alliaceus]KAB8232983.1 hypothetical protein BDW43DRAFT_311717 [Aspergillus alliaceus]